MTARFKPNRSAIEAVRPSPSSSARPMGVVAVPSATTLRAKVSSSQMPYTTNRLSLANPAKKIKPIAPNAARSRLSSRHPSQIRMAGRLPCRLRPSGGMTSARATRLSSPNPPNTKQGDCQPQRSMSRPTSGIPIRVVPAQLNSITPMTNPRRW